MPKWEYKDNFVKEVDIKVLKQAVLLLKSPKDWDKNDDRYCLFWAKKSLFCALALAQKDVDQEYKHRSIPSQEVRFSIEELYPDRSKNHPLLNFNNHPKTTLSDVQRVISETILRIEKRLDTQKSISSMKNNKL